MGGKISDTLPAAAALEIFHNFTLAHDDIMDNSMLRRGKKTINSKWDNNTGILSGDVMLIISYEVLNQYQDSKYIHLSKNLLKYQDSFVKANKLIWILHLKMTLRKMNILR